MEYFLSHILYVVIAGAIVGGIAFLSVYLAQKNAETRTEEENKARAEACQSCKLASMCARFAQENGSSCADREPSIID